MSGKSIISNSYLEDIGDAIRYKKGTEETFYPSQMGDAIRSIEGIVPVGSIEIDANGVYNVTEKAEAVVSVQPDLRPLSVSENGQYSPDDFDGYSDVTVDVEPALESLSVTENGLYLPDTGVDGFDRVSVDVPQKWDINVLASGTYDFSTDNGVLVLDTATSLVNNMFRAYTTLTRVVAPNVETITAAPFYSCSNLTSVYFPKLKSIAGEAFRYSGLTGNFHEMFPVIEEIGDRTFQDCKFVMVHLPESVSYISTRGFNDCRLLDTVYLHSKPTMQSNCLTSYAKHIYVPWSQGEVANAPWGATSATIHYDTVYDSEWNVISST